jgi:hypothetical protein
MKDFENISRNNFNSKAQWQEHRHEQEELMWWRQRDNKQWEKVQHRKILNERRNGGCNENWQGDPQFCVPVYDQYLQQEFCISKPARF